MSITVGVLRIDLEAGTASFSEAMDKMEHLSAKTADSVKKSLEKIAIAGTLIGSAIVGGTAEMVKKSMEAIVSLEHMSQAAGTTIDRLSELNYAAQRVGVPTELLVKGMERLANSAFKAQNGNVALAAIFERLGIHTRDSSGHLKDTGLLIDEIAPKFSNMADGAGKTALAIQLFGRGGAIMIPFLNEWGAHMDELKEKARQFGMVIGPEVAERTVKFHEVLNGLKMAWQGFGLQLTAAALPALTAFATQLEKLALKANIPQLAESFGKNLATALTLAGTALQFVVEHAKALEVVFAGLIALRVANIAVPLIATAGSVSKIIEGFSKAGQSTLGITELVKSLKTLGDEGKIAKDFIGPLEEGMVRAGGASSLLAGSIAFLTNPVVLAVGAITTLTAVMYAYRDSTFKAFDATYRYADAYSALWKIITTRRMPGGFSGALSDAKKDREAAELAAKYPFVMGGSVDANRPKLDQPDTSGLGVPKKDVFGELIAKLKLATLEQNRYLAVLHGTPEEIQKVAIAEKADADILKLTNELIDSHIMKKGQKLALDKQEEIRANVAAEMNAKAAREYLSGLVNQQNGAELATTQIRALAKAHLEGDEAVRLAAIDNEILAAKFHKLGAETPEFIKELATLRDLRAGKSNVDIVEGANKSTFSLQQQLRALQILIPASIQYTDALREAELQAATLAVTERINSMAEGEAKDALIAERQATIDLTRAKWAHADAQAAIALRSPIEVYKAEIDVLEHQREALEKAQGSTLTYEQSMVLASKAQDAFNKLTDDTIKLLLRQNSAGAGVKAFFLDMQKQAQTSASIIYDALHSAFDKVSDQLTELVTGGKTNFAKMFQDIGKQMVSQTIKSGLQTVLGKIGEKFGISLPGNKPDGTEKNPLWVRMAGMAGMPGGGGNVDWAGGDKSIDDNGLYPGEDGYSGGGMLGGLMGKLGGLFGGGSKGGGIFSMIASLFGKGDGGGMSGLISTLMGSLPMFAEGGTPSPGSAYIAGERGPELLFASGEIASNSASQRMLSAPAQNHYYTIDARGTDPVLTEQRTKAAIIAAHNSAVSGGFMASQEYVKRTPRRS